MENIRVFHAKKIVKPKNKDATTSHKNIWFTKNGQKYMFKLPSNDSVFCHALLNEVIISKMCARLGIPCQQANFAKYEFWDTKGIIIKSFLARGEKEISVTSMQKYYAESYLTQILGEDFFDDFIYPVLEHKDLTTLLHLPNKDYASTVLRDYNANNIRSDVIEKLCIALHIATEKGSIHDIRMKFDPKAIQKLEEHVDEINYLADSFTKDLTDLDVIKLAQFYAKTHDLELAPGYEDQVCAYAVFDYLSVQEDRNTGNISFIQHGDKLSLAPIFDNGLALFFSEKGDEVRTCSEKSGGNRILMTSLTKSKLDDEQSLVCQYKEKMSDFVRYDFEEFSEDFVARYPECVDFGYLTEGKEYPGKNNIEFIRSYFKKSQTAMQMRLDDLEQNKNIDYNEQKHFIPDSPSNKESEEQQSR